MKLTKSQLREIIKEEVKKYKLENNSISNVDDIIEMMDKTSVFNKYYDSTAKWGNAVYVNVPVSLFKKIGLSITDLKKIQSNTRTYDSNLDIENGKVTLYYGEN